MYRQDSWLKSQCQPLMFKKESRNLSKEHRCPNFSTFDNFHLDGLMHRHAYKTALVGYFLCYFVVICTQKESLNIQEVNRIHRIQHYFLFSVPKNVFSLLGRTNQHHSYNPLSALWKGNKQCNQLQGISCKGNKSGIGCKGKILPFNCLYTVFVGSSQC